MEGVIGKERIPRTRRWRVVVAFVLFPGLVGIGMWVLGTAYGDRRAEDSRQRRRADLEEYQAAHLRDLGVGTNLGSVLVRGADGHSQPLNKALPAGGLMVYVAAGCESCFGVAEALNGAVQHANSMDAIMLVHGDPSDLRRFCRDRDLQVPVLQDTEDVFALRYMVAAFPSHVVLDERCRVLEIGAGLDQEDDYARILAHGRTRPEDETPNFKRR